MAAQKDLTAHEKEEVGFEERKKYSTTRPRSSKSLCKTYKSYLVSERAGTHSSFS
jgi:hypothetical protein